MEIEFKKLFRNASENLLRMRVVTGMLAREYNMSTRFRSVGYFTNTKTEKPEQ